METVVPGSPFIYTVPFNKLFAPGVTTLAPIAPNPLEMLCGDELHPLKLYARTVYSKVLIWDNAPMAVFEFQSTWPGTPNETMRELLSTVNELNTANVVKVFDVMLVVIEPVNCFISVVLGGLFKKNAGRPLIPFVTNAGEFIAVALFPKPDLSYQMVGAADKPPTVLLVVGVGKLKLV
jgi:hypothetical protein